MFSHSQTANVLHAAQRAADTPQEAGEPGAPPQPQSLATIVRPYQ